MKYIETIPARIAGIPAQVGVTYYHHQRPWSGSAATCPSDMDYFGYSESDWEVLDSRGRPAPWLDRKLSDAARREVSALVAQHMERGHE